MSNGFNPNKFIKGSDECEDHLIEKEIVPVNINTAEPTKSKKSSKKEVIVANDNTDLSSLNFTQSNIPYMDAYKETNKQLDDSIKQLDILGNELVNSLVAVKASKTLKNKYNYINDMTATVTSIINTKIGAIKEKNKTINDTNSMEIRRIKELKLNESQEDDNQRIMNLYDAFINTPIGTYAGSGSILGPSMSDMVISNSNLNKVTMDGTFSNDINQQAWQQGLDPAQSRMLLDAQGKIETVVMYDASSGNRWFEVVDKTTGQPIQNVEKPDNTFIYDLDINTNGNYAKDPNTNAVYRLITLNGDQNMSEF